VIYKSDGVTPADGWFYVVITPSSDLLVQTNDFSNAGVYNLVLSGTSCKTVSYAFSYTLLDCRSATISTFTEAN
jgi:hypothetical protein